MKTSGHVSNMLKGQKKHISFHTPGHKRSGWDITELSYSDNLSSPKGVIALAEQDIASILRAYRSFILTDGSTCGVLSMIYALKLGGVKTLLLSPYCHPSAKNGCLLAGITPVWLPARFQEGILQQPTVQEVVNGLEQADAVFLTSPDYYGNFADLASIGVYCEKVKKPLVVDGAHGAHTHFYSLHAGKFADMWVDGAHKSLPTLTQGAVLSAREERWAEQLSQAVDIFRTSSPSYPIMASVEEGVKYPRNVKLERYAREMKVRVGAYPNADWAKIVVCFGEKSSFAQRYLEKKGVYAEFNDGNYLMFYLSPATRIRHLKKLERLLKKLPRGSVQFIENIQGEKMENFVWIAMDKAVGRVCARSFGLFPPCIPVAAVGDVITAEHVQKIKNADSTFGVVQGKLLVYEE